MRRIAAFAISTVALLVLLFSYRTSRGPGATVAPPAAYGDTQVGVVAQPTPAASGSSATGGSASTSDRTVVNGTVAQTRWGPVQVQVVIEAGRITDLTALQYPQENNRDRQINSYALPILRERVLSAQSASIDVVSGATVTSVGYLDSLQAALDMANFPEGSTGSSS